MLRSYKLGEADRIVVFLGEKTGQFRAVAKGVRRTSSKFGGRLDSFNLVDLQSYRGRGELFTLTQAETLKPYSAQISGDFSAFTSAKVMVEAAQKATEDRDLTSSDQFALLHGGLHALARRSHPSPLIAASYLLRVAATEGWSPTVGRCAVCGSTRALVKFSPSAGGAVCLDCAPADARPVQLPVLSLAARLLEGQWARAEAVPTEYWGETLDLAGTWLQWQIEQRLRALPFVSLQDSRG